MNLYVAVFTLGFACQFVRILCVRLAKRSGQYEIIGSPTYLNMADGLALRVIASMPSGISLTNRIALILYASLWVSGICCLFALIFLRGL